MLHLNLIAEEDKQAIKYQRLYFLLLQAEIILLLLLLLTGSVIFSAEKILAASILQTTRETNKLINSNSADYNIKAKELNEKITTVAQIESKPGSYPRIYRDISALIPANISISLMNINSGAKTIKIYGLSPARQDLLDLETNLKSAPWLTKVNVPFEEKLGKKNINFDISLEFDLAKMP
jgi:Tfp pilus assembly protein PilN